MSKAGSDSDAPGFARLQVVICAPVGRDAELISSSLAAAALKGRAVETPAALLNHVEKAIASAERADVGAVVATDEALGIDWSVRLADTLDRQPSWSDLPIVLLARSPSANADERWLGASHAAAVSERLMLRGSVTVLDRPVRVATLISAVRAALRARARQLEACDLLKSRTAAQEAAERAARAKSDFLALMSHELRTPLNAIAGYADLLATECYGPVSAQQREALNRIMSAQRHLLGIINDVLNYAKLERDRVDYDIRDVLLSAVIDEVTPLVEPQLKARCLTYAVRRVASDIVVRADPEKLRQVLLNLLSNAIKFTRPGGEIHVEIAERADRRQPQDRVFLRVADTGVGIPADRLASVFEPFVQIRSDTITKRDGTGLGLSISRELARAMGGDLRVRSELGKGSAFTIELRRVSARRDAT